MKATYPIKPAHCGGWNPKACEPESNGFPGMAFCPWIEWELGAPLCAYYDDDADDRNYEGRSDDPKPLAWTMANEPLRRTDGVCPFGDKAFKITVEARP